MSGLKFDNPMMEDLCRSLLTPEENRLKLVSLQNKLPSAAHIFSAGTLRPDYRKVLEEEVSSAEQDLKKVRMALVLCDLAETLGAKLVEE